MKNYISHSPEQTEQIAAEFASTLKSGDVIAYKGPMGAGKTAFTRGLCRGLGLDDPVSSPTFALVHQYGNGEHALYHFDMYRVESYEDLYSTGFFDYLDVGGILVVEWSENIEGALPEDAIRVFFQRGASESERTITIEKGGESA